MSDRGFLLVEQPECEHTPSPDGYVAWFDFAAKMTTRGYVQERCPICGLWAIWTPRAAGEAKAAHKQADAGAGR